MTLAAMKNYLYFLQDTKGMQALSKAKPADMIAKDPLLTDIYQKVTFQIINNLSVFTQTDLIRMFFELSTKRTLRYEYNTDKILAFFNDLDLDKMAVHDFQDFIYVGYILTNIVVRSSFSSDLVARYYTILQK